MSKYTDFDLDIQNVKVEVNEPVGSATYLCDYTIDLKCSEAGICYCNFEEDK